ncbi:MAG: hypothetical protein HYZ00_10780 [Candidatus Hydrogenedentes bacterium]|nr:hypothetical protein [Candidatus Hydrogenedentota bacterium]
MGWAVTAAAAVLMMAWGAPLEAASLKVAPAHLIIHDVAPGQPYDLFKETGLKFAVYNDDDSARTWALATHRPSERGRWELGYTEIPDASWCRFDTATVEVTPHGIANANLLIEVPPDEAYCNQQWVVTASVGSPEGAGVSIGVDIRIQVETAPNPHPVTPPAGDLGIYPSVVRIEAPAPGVPLTGTLMVRNNTDQPLEPQVSRLFDHPKIDPKNYLTHGRVRLPDPARLTWSPPSAIGPGETATISLGLTLPQDATGPGKHWEELLLIETPGHDARFARVQIGAAPAQEEAKTSE